MNKEKALIIAYAIIALSGAKYEEIPAKARWIAQDADGSWWWHIKKPRCISRSPIVWTPPGGIKRSNANMYGNLSFGSKPKDFTKEIYKL